MAAGTQAAGAVLGLTGEAGPTAVAVGDALRAIRERVRGVVLHCGKQNNGSIGSLIAQKVSSEISSHTNSNCTSSNSSSSCSNSNSPGSHPDASRSNSTFSSCCESMSGSTRRAPVARVGVRVRLVAVSKRQSAAAVAAAAAAGQRHFAENYVQELIAKAGELRRLNLSWHMIGHLQSNKAKLLLAAIPDLYMVETVDSIRLARILDAAVAAVMPQRAYKPLRVLVQVNTSGESSKSGLRLPSKDSAPGPEDNDKSPSARAPQQHGVEPQEFHQQQQEGQPQSQHPQLHFGQLQDVVQCIVNECSHLRFAGLMTIGPPDTEGARRAFDSLVAIKHELLSSLPVVQAMFQSPLQPSGSFPQLRDEDMIEASARSPLDDYLADEREGIFELSMGMSYDYEEAIRAGSTEIRVGTAIFGERPFTIAGP